jgi:hypothetical protein
MMKAKNEGVTRYYYIIRRENAAGRPFMYLYIHYAILCDPFQYLSTYRLQALCKYVVAFDSQC